MIAEIITIGTELLLGDVVDTNSAYLAQALKDFGINVFHIQTVGDNPDRLKAALSQAQSRSDFVFAVGGLGPTADDITKDVLAKLLGVDLVLDPPSYARLKTYFEARQVDMTPNNLKQAQIPAGTRPLANPKGLATGVWSESHGCVTILLPGPPQEMVAMFEAQVTDKIQPKDAGTLYSHTYRFLGIGESHLDDALAPYMKGANPTLAPYAGNGEVSLRLTARASSPEEAETRMSPIDAVIRSRFGHALYGVDVPNMATACHQALLVHQQTIATAESCTGGMIAKALTDHAGSSQYFMGGVVAYSNRAKTDMLGVSKACLAQYGAVSPQTAVAMAQGAREKFHTSMAISTTGVAGPGGGSAQKPVGTVYMGLVTDDLATSFKLIDLPDHYRTRPMIRHMTSQYALFYVLKALCEVSDL